MRNYKIIFLRSFFICCALLTSGAKSGCAPLGKNRDKDASPQTNLGCPRKQSEQITIITDVPAAICLNVDSSCNLYACDFNNHRVMKFDSQDKLVGWVGQKPDGSLQTTWSPDGNAVKGTRLGAFHQPHAVDFDGSGNLYITEYGNNRIQKLNSSGAAQGSFGILPNGQFKSGYTTDVTINTQHASGLMQGIATAYFATDGFMYLSDFDGHSVIRITPQGSFVGWIGLRSDNAPSSGWQTDNTAITSSSLGGFKKPHATVVGADRSIFIADTHNHRIVRYSNEGKPIGWIGETQQNGLTKGWQVEGIAKQSNLPGGFYAPTSINLDKNGDLIIADFGNHRVQKFSQSGEFLGWIGCNENGENTAAWRKDGGSKSGSQKGCFTHPYDARVAGNFLYIADTHNSRIQIIDLEFEN